MLLFPLFSFIFACDFASGSVRGRLSLEQKSYIAKLLKLKITDFDLLKTRLETIGKSSSLSNVASSASEGFPIDRKKLKLVNLNESRPISPALINLNSGMYPYLYEGDIIVTQNQLLQFEAHRTKRQVSRGANVWVNNTVFYYFAPNYFDNKDETEARKTIQMGLDFISKDTCVKFVENSTAENRIQIIDGNGCYSYLGMLGGEQALSLSSGCLVYPNTVAHEFMHALGFIHTQSRTDRNHFVDIDLTHVDKDLHSNFNMDVYSKILNAYDYGSVMHYDARSFVYVPGQYSVIPKDMDYLFTIGSPLISFNDVQAINELYKCNENCVKGKSAVCLNKGYPHPQNCGKCICPMGFGGTFCETRATNPNKKGHLLFATSQWSPEVSTFAAGNGNYDLVSSWIRAPRTKKIQVKITKLANFWCDYGCDENGIELKLLADPTETGPRICCTEFIGETYTSQENLLPIVAYSYSTQFNVTFSFRYV